MTDLALNDGTRLPAIGFGVFRMGQETSAAVATALAAGYRLIDTAAVYGNEQLVGRAIRESTIPRDSVTVTTKVWRDDFGYDATLRAVDRSSRLLGVERIDLCLLHWPVSGLRNESWRALEHLQSQGVVRSIGVSNFMEHHLAELLAHATVPPAVNQLEIHPFMQQPEAVAASRAGSIVVEAYSPLAKAAALNHPVVVDIADRCGAQPAQVLLAWSMQRGFVPLPKSSDPARIRSNFAGTELRLPDSDLALLDALDEGRATGWDPRTVV